MKIAGKVCIGEQQPKGPTTQIVSLWRNNWREGMPPCKCSLGIYCTLDYFKPMMNGTKNNGITQQKAGTKRRANGFSIEELLQQQEGGEGQQQNGHRQKWGKQEDSVQMMITPKRSRKGTMGKGKKL
jgi:hypothetical protein